MMVYVTITMLESLGYGLSILYYFVVDAFDIVIVLLLKNLI